MNGANRLECLLLESHMFLIGMMNVLMLNVIMRNVIMLNVIYGICHYAEYRYA
jgi:hypothetical protein